MTQAIKLSKKQKEVIEFMRKGATLSHFVRYSNWVASIAPYVIFGKTQIKLQSTTLVKIKDMGLICKSERKSADPHIPEVFYELTDLGKTIEL